MTNSFRRRNLCKVTCIPHTKRKFLSASCYKHPRTCMIFNEAMPLFVFFCSRVLLRKSEFQCQFQHFRQISIGITAANINASCIVVIQIFIFIFLCPSEAKKNLWLSISQARIIHKERKLTNLPMTKHFLFLTVTIYYVSLFLTIQNTLLI